MEAGPTREAPMGKVSRGIIGCVLRYIRLCQAIREGRDQIVRSYTHG